MILNSQKMLTMIAIVTVLTITAFGSFAAVTALILAQNMTSGSTTGGNMTHDANMTGGNVTSMMSNSTG